MGSVKIELNYGEVGKLLKSSEVEAVCKSLAEQIAGKAGDGYEVSTHVGKTRVNASVAAESLRAKRDNLKNNTLLKALQ